MQFPWTDGESKVLMMYATPKQVPNQLPAVTLDPGGQTDPNSVTGSETFEEVRRV